MPADSWAVPIEKTIAVGETIAPLSYGLPTLTMSSTFGFSKFWLNPIECYYLSATTRITAETITIKQEGSHTHKSSLLITAKPHLLKKDPTPIGETMIGLHGEKYLVLSKGNNRAIPKPPLVKASRIP